jgi:hypothetical protein
MHRAAELLDPGCPRLEEQHAGKNKCESHWQPHSIHTILFHVIPLGFLGAVRMLSSEDGSSEPKRVRSAASFEDGRVTFCGLFDFGQFDSVSNST